MPVITSEMQDKISDQILEGLEAIELGEKLNNAFIDKHTDKLADSLDEPFKSIMKDKTSRNLLMGNLLKSFGITGITIIKDSKA